MPSDSEVSNESNFPSANADWKVSESNVKGVPPYHLKPNAFVFASIKATPRMLDILALLFTEMTEGDWFDENGEQTTPDYYFKNDKLKKWFGIDRVEALAATLRTPAQRLSSTAVGIYSKTKQDFAFFPIFQEISYKGGVLKITPNSSLRNEYIINANSEAGFAKVSNHVYLALKDTYSKRMLDMLSRFRTEVSSLYPISVERLQKQFGIIGQNNKVLMKTYESPSRFVSHVIKPSLIKISQSEEAQGVLEVLESPSGALGYELIDFDGANPKILFHCKWLTEHSEEDIAAASKRIIESSHELKRMASVGEEPSIDFLLAFQSDLKICKRDAEVQRVEERISAMKAKMAIQKKLKEKAKAEAMAGKVNELLDSGFLDDIL